MDFLSVASLPPLISSILFLFIGIVVLKNNKKSSLNISFLALCVTTFIWQFTMFLLFNTKEAEIAKALVRVAHIGIIFLPVTFFQFGLNLTGRVKKFDNYLLVFNYFVSFIFLLTLFSNLLIDDFYVYFWSFYPRAGILHPFYLLLLTLTVSRLIYIYWVVLYKEKNLSDALRHQLNYVLWATVFYIFAASDFLLNYGVEFYPIGFFFVLIFIAITSYAIIRHRLMDTKIVLRQSSVFILSFSLIAVVAFFLSLLNTSENKYFNIANIAIVLFLVVLFPYVKSFFYRFANKYFFTSLYDSKKVISTLNFNLRSTLELEYIYEALFDSVDSAFHSESFGFLTFDSRDSRYTFKYKQGKFIGLADTCQGNFRLHQQYSKKNKVIILSELENEKNFEFLNTINYFKEMGIEVLVPVSIKWRNIGLLALGKKETKDMYSNEDVNLLEIIGGLGATAIENGVLYKNISEKNKELENILKAKTDFLRIANHQLNTPLSIMRLAYSSVDEKTISIDQGFFMARKGLNRLTDVISQLWTVLDLDSNDIRLKEEKIDLFEMFKEVVKEKRKLDLAKSKKLKISINVSKKTKDYFVVASKQKIREVFSGLIDNAIFYSLKGRVDISLKSVKNKNGQFIKTTVTDTGIGISDKDKKTIYEKFSRGEKATLFHPDGSGVGLYIAKRVIKESGGVFLLEKTSNKSGTVFSFTLPLFKD